MSELVLIRMTFKERIRNMKKISVLLIFLSFILTGCLNPAAVGIVEDMYKQALMEDDEAITSYLSTSYLDAHPVEELANELREQVRDAKGVSLLNAIEVKRNRLNADITEILDEAYHDQWHFIVLDAPEDHVIIWIVLKTKTKYEVVDGGMFTVEEYNENVLK